MKKFKYVTALMAALGTCGVMGYAPEGRAEEGDVDKSLPPLVMIIFDTSTSMDSSFGSGYTRLTKAIAELAGKPKTTPVNHKYSIPQVLNYGRIYKTYMTNSSNSGLGSSRYKYMMLPRMSRVCKDGKCQFQDTCVAMKNDVSSIPFMTANKDICEAHDYYNDYHETGVLHSYMHNVKFGFTGLINSTTTDLYGYHGEIVDSVSGWRHGLKITDAYKTSNRAGIYTASPSSPAPTLYPTVSDETQDILDSNKAVITSIRAYYADSSTPVGPALADIYYMFSKPDPGIVAQPSPTYDKKDGKYKDLSNLVGKVDHKFACRKKAVIVVTDGSPNAGQSGDSKKGQTSKIWLDAGRLYDELGVRVYPIAYAYTTAPSSCSEMDPMDKGCSKSTSSYHTGERLNKVAWRGGTCRDKNGLIINANSESAYNNFVEDKSTTVEERTCYYNAYDSDALRKAFITVLSDMLSGVTSKTAVATTTAIGQKHNYNKVTDTWSNGYYNVYSGYEVTMGPVRNTVLQRAAIICDHTSGSFVNKDDQFLDLTKRLKARLVEITKVEELENTGYGDSNAPDLNDAPDACAKRGSGPSVANVVDAGSNKCINERYIFTGNYSGADLYRYKISTFGGSGDIIENVPIQNSELAGYLPKALNQGDAGDVGDARDANFMEKQNLNYEDTTCTTAMNTDITEYFQEANYILNPYECGDDFDCGTKGDEPRLCDLGRCLDPGAFESSGVTQCTSKSSKSSSTICIVNHLRSKKSGGCSTHAECVNKCGSDSCVCHAGYCLAGTVIGCDVRQFMSTVPLGTIEYATPVPVAPPTKAYKSAQYRKFSTKYWKRDSMLMVGANDGMLHAFILGDNQDATDYKSGLYDTSDVLPGHKALEPSNHEGDELWAFVPKMSYKNLYKLPSFTSQQFVNTKPVVADVQLPGLTIDEDTWRTVIVGGYREGGRGYYALDITNPAKPFILWEIDHQWQPGTDVEYPDIYDDSMISAQKAIDNIENVENGNGYPFQLMGYTYTEPVITNLMIDDKVEPVAILSGGRTNASDRDYDMVGRALYIVRLYPKSKKDLLVKTFYFDSPVTGTPEVYPNNFNSVAQHIYVGDAKGALYRLNVSDKDIAKWGSRNKEGNLVNYSTIQAKATLDATKLTTYSIKHEVPIFYPTKMTGFNGLKFKEINFKPSVALFGYLNNSSYPTIQITFGTGSNDNFNVANSDHHFVANFIDVPDDQGVYQLNRKDVPCFSPSMLLFNTSISASSDPLEDSNYGEQKYTLLTKDPVSNVQFEDYQKMTGAPLIHNYVSYFPTFTGEDSNEECVSGQAHIWKLDSRKSCSVSGVSNYRLPAEAVQNETNNLFADRSFYSLGEGTKVYGLELTNQMYCIADCVDEPSCDPDDPKCCRNRVLAPQLIAQTGNETPQVHTDQGSASLMTEKSIVNSLAINLEAVRPEVSRVTWAGVYE